MGPSDLLMMCNGHWVCTSAGERENRPASLVPGMPRLLRILHEQVHVAEHIHALYMLQGKKKKYACLWSAGRP